MQNCMQLHDSLMLQTHNGDQAIVLVTASSVRTRVTSYVIRSITVLAKQLQYSGQKYVDLKLVSFQSVWYQNSIQHKQNVRDH